MTQYAAILATLTVVWTWPSRSRAAEPACPPPPVETDRLVNARWPDLAGGISRALDGRRDVDRCARIAITLDTRAMATTAIVLEVVLRDGRSASRSVSRAEDVIPTLEGLLLLPEVDASWPGTGLVSTAAPPPRVPVRGSQGASATVEFATMKPSAPVRQPPRFGVELSVAAGARIGDGQTGVGVGALTFLDVGSWLLGFEGAVDHYQSSEGSSAVDVLKLAVLAGRRFRLGSTALDLTAGPALALNGPGKKVAVQAGTASGAGSSPPESGGLQKRFVCGARLIFRGGSVVRTFAGIEGELALKRSASALLPVEPRLPAWSAGVVVGATVGTP